MKKTPLFLSALTIALSACVGTAFAAPVTVKIATITPLSGSNSGMGSGIKNAAQLAVNEMKAEFAAAGMNLSLVAYDDQADATTGISVARRAVNDKSILGIVGTLNSGVIIPASDAVKDSHLIFVSPGTTNPKVTDRGLKNVNRVIARDDSEGPAGGDFIADTLKAKKVYVLNDKTPYGQGLAEEAEKQLKARGVTIVQSEGVSADERDFSAIITKIQALKPDVVYFGAMYGQAGPFVKQVRDKGLTLPIVGGAGFDSDDMIKLAGGNTVSDLYFTTSAPPIDALPNAKATAAAFKNAFNADLDGFGALGYDAAKVLLQSILNAAKANGNKVPTRIQVENGIRTGKYTGLLTGDLSFNSKGDRATAKIYVIAVKGGQRSTLGTQEVVVK